MSETAEGATASPPACQPFTFGGQATFAQGRPGRLMLAELIVAILVAVCVVAFLQHAYAPVILQTIGEMPETAKIADGRLIGIDTAIIAETKLLAIAVTPAPSDTIGQSSDVQVQFRPSNVRIGSVYRPDWGWEFDYGPGPVVDLSRSSLDPWWGAWRPVLLAAAGVLVLMALFFVWAALALVYTLPAKLLAWFGDRDLTWDAAWRLGSAAMLPGALLVGLAVLLYGWQEIDLVGLAFFYVAHLISGWVYLIGGTLACPRLHEVAPKQNPFVS
jgi:hypothetical protein